jgi:hypothetical protein
LEIATHLLQHGREKAGGSKLGRPWPENGVKLHRRRIHKSNTVFQINIMSNGFLIKTGEKLFICLYYYKRIDGE